ncbi:MAG: hypothetical protein A3E82_07740 [Gammaproteobacteria bacterium RIFCSPHIGHO2_12_FULL_38_11]|nr:MAG: hypothetical protein A3E82_07740 [Gammaproteobacteria bacterium RIFCSPHIGHO2_12_FULL_38_11]
METLKQILTIPENHKIHFDVTLPENFPTGQVEVLLVFSTKTAASNDIMNAELLELAGSLRNSPHFGGDSMLIQKALRNEWDR